MENLEIFQGYLKFSRLSGDDLSWGLSFGSKEGFNSTAKYNLRSVHLGETTIDVFSGICLLEAYERACSQVALVTKNASKFNAFGTIAWSGAHLLVPATEIHARLGTASILNIPT